MSLERIGPYRIVRLLGKGGMGAVYEALHEAIERRVAIKVLHAELGRRSDIATRFVNEARAVNRIEHPGLVQISDYGQLPDGVAYIVMEYLKGETLGQRLKRVSGRMPTHDVIRLGRQICTALAAAHEKDIVHRDLKPDNIMIVPNPDVPGGEQVKILDFGIAKIAESETGISEAHTRADALLGTPKYMSPEQCRGSGGVDAKSDVYSLGIIFYELLAGQPPFLGSAHGELLVQHIMQEPPPLASLADAATPEVLTRLVHSMLTKDKATRPTMRQAVAELDRMGGYLSGVYGVVSMGPGTSGPGVAPITPTPPPGWVPGPTSMPGVPSLPSFPSLPGGAVRSYNGMTPVPVAVQTAPASTLAMSAGQVPTPPQRRFPVSIVIGVLAGAVVVSAVLLRSLYLPPPAPHKPVVQAPPPPPPPAAPAPPEQPKTVHWSLITTPEGAKVVRQRDGQLLGTTPLALDTPKGSGFEPVRIMLPGYSEMPLSLALDKDSDLQIELRRKGGHERRNKDPGSKTNGKGYVPGDLTVVD